MNYYSDRHEARVQIAQAKKNVKFLAKFAAVALLAYIAVLVIILT